jgi:hypothetical protein
VCLDFHGKSIYDSIQRASREVRGSLLILLVKSHRSPQLLSYQRSRGIMSDKDVKDYVGSSSPAVSFDYGVAESKETSGTTRITKYVRGQCAFRND